MTHALGLAANAWLTDHGRHTCAVGYRVTGLTPDDICLIEYAGISAGSEAKWKLSWRRSTAVIPTPDELFDSPEDALAVVDTIVHS